MSIIGGANNVLRGGQPFYKRLFPLSKVSFFSLTANCEHPALYLVLFQVYITNPLIQSSIY